MTEREMGKVCIMKPIKKSSDTIRRKFDETFKREVVSNWLSSGKSAGVIAQELGLKTERLYAWRTRFAPADAGGKAAAGAKPRSYAELQSELDAAMRENRHLKEQRDILKKTLGILSEPPANGANGFMR